MAKKKAPLKATTAPAKKLEPAAPKVKEPKPVVKAAPKKEAAPAVCGHPNQELLTDVDTMRCLDCGALLGSV
jgi:hypothetical protein